MKLGLFIDYAGRTLDVRADLVREAERLGFDSVWTAEAYGSDALTPLAYLAAHTRHIRLGSGVAQLAGRTAAMAAMQFATVDQLAGGSRVIAGLGVSGPQIVEGWYGRPWGRPVDELRDYTAILRKVWRREAPLEHDGAAIRLPTDDAGALGVGKPLKSLLHANPDIPVWFGTGSPRAVALTAEIADGWLPMGFVPGMLDVYRPWLDKGFARSGRTLADLEIQAQAYVSLTDDVGGAVRAMKSMAALYVGGMGHPKMNFHKQQMERRGYADAAARIEELFRAGHRDEAVAAVPDEYVDEGMLAGDEARIAARFAAWRDSGATGLTLHCGQIEALQLLARLAEARPRDAARAGEEELR